MRKQSILTDEQRKAFREKYDSIKEEDIDTTDPDARVIPWGEGRVVSSPKTRAAGQIFRPIKTPMTIRVDADVLEWFRADGEGYQSRINEALREHMNRKRS